MEPRAREKGLEINWERPSKNVPAVSLDQEKIRTVLLGILDNAIRYTKKGNITVRLEKSNDGPARRSRHPGGEGGGVVVSIADTGKGLSKEEVKDAFTSFKRGKTAQALWTEGVGLSLYIAKQGDALHCD